MTMTEEQGRFLIAQYALSQLTGHYLPGARGGIPGGGSHLGRTVSLKYDKSWDKLRLHAGSNSLGVCYGRWARLGSYGYLFQPSTSKLQDLKDYVKANQGTPVDFWPDFETRGTSPRRLGKAGSAIAMGEDCRGHRHFDCIGFIHWVLNEVRPEIPWFNLVIKQYSDGGGALEKLGLISKNSLLPGDIVVRMDTDPHHIGIATGTGLVVHASRESDGVLVEDFAKGRWTGVSRVKASVFGSGVSEVEVQKPKK